MSANDNSVDLEVLLSVTRQNLVATILAKTELEALVQELRAKVKELETKNSKAE